MFQEVKDGRARVISFLAKKARGAMARYIIDNRIEEPSALKDFAVDGYAYSASESSDDRWIFKRPQP